MFPAAEEVELGRRREAGREAVESCWFSWRTFLCWLSWGAWLFSPPEELRTFLSLRIAVAHHGAALALTLSTASWLWSRDGTLSNIQEELARLAFPTGTQLFLAMEGLKTSLSLRMVVVLYSF